MGPEAYSLKKYSRFYIMSDDTHFFQYSISHCGFSLQGLTTHAQLVSSLRDKYHLCG